MKQQSILSGRSGHAITGARPRNKKHDIALQPRGPQPDHSLVAPIRQTASIFKQPVTVYKEHKSKVKSDLKHVSREKPLQVFWTKRLSSPYTTNIEEGERSNKISLPLKLSSVGPGITNHMLLASISTHLHISKDSAVGQQANMSLIDKNPAAYINPNQPLMSKVEVDEEDILAQEARVEEARKRLARAVKALG